MKKFWINVSDEIDIVAVGVQECAYKASNGQHQDPHFDNCVKECCGEDFVMLSKHHLWEMRLYVLARKKHEKFITNIEQKTEATGIAHILGNKGGVIIKLEAYGSSLCFISCHLAAHQGKVNDRNGNCAEICRNARLSNKHLDVTSQFHHCFLFGDLNYRIDLPSAGRFAEWDDADDDTKWDAVKDLVDEEKWSELYAGDQLVREIKAGRTLAGFKETVPAFMPTFKVERQVGTEFKRQRIPAWCDRILVRSLPTYEADITNMSFTSCPDLSTSDHKPGEMMRINILKHKHWARTLCSYSVLTHCTRTLYSVKGVYSISVQPPLQMSEGGPTLVFDELHCKNLIIADFATSDPYVYFFSDPPNLFAGKKTPKTEVVKRSLNPTFKPQRLPR
jgi:hypothetical protein